MSESKEKNPLDDQAIIEMEESEQEVDTEVTVDASLEKAIEAYKKLCEQHGPLHDKQLADLEKK